MPFETCLMNRGMSTGQNVGLPGNGCLAGWLSGFCHRGRSLQKNNKGANRIAVRTLVGRQGGRWLSNGDRRRDPAPGQPAAHSERLRVPNRRRVLPVRRPANDRIARTTRRRPSPAHRYPRVFPDRDRSAEIRQLSCRTPSCKQIGPVGEPEEAKPSVSIGIRSAPNNVFCTLDTQRRFWFVPSRPGVGISWLRSAAAESLFGMAQKDPAECATSPILPTPHLNVMARIEISAGESVCLFCGVQRKRIAYTSASWITYRRRTGFPEWELTLFPLRQETAPSIASPTIGVQSARV